MAMLQGTKALEVWCRKVTEGYDHVNVVNMTTSWRSGLGFCAIIHRFRPELVDYKSLDPDNVYGNNEMAFATAEQHLGIPSLLDPQDMAECELLDRLSILTYLSQFYQAFHGATSPSKETSGPLHKLRYTTGTASSSRSSSEASSPSKSSISGSRRNRSEPCRLCGNAVFILERLNVSGKLLHRTCFKCARCQTQLSIANYYETEAGAYCCDMCPDEELSQAQVAEANKKIVEHHLDSSTSEDEEDDNAKSGRVSQNSLPESMQRREEDDNSTMLKAEVVRRDDSSCEDVLVTVSMGPSNNNEQEETPAVNDDNNDDDNNNDKDNDQVAQTCTTVNEEATSTESPIELNRIPDEVQEAIVVTEEEEEENPISLPVANDNQEEDLEEAPAEGKKVEDHLDTNVDLTAEHEVKIVEDNAEQVVVVEPEEDDGHKEEEEEQDASYPGDLNPFDHPVVVVEQDKSKEDEVRVVHESTNPFGSDLEDSDDEKKTSMGTPLVGPPKPPRVSLNPFGSDFEDDDEDTGSSKGRSPGKRRKKRPAPKPPGQTNATSTPIPSPRPSLRPSPECPTPAPRPSVVKPGRPPPPRPPPPADLPKQRKERDNLNRRSQQLMETSSISDASSIMSTSTTQSDAMGATAAAAANNQQLPAIILTPLSPDKAHSEGQWKRKKGPAPPRPIPPKRQVKKLPRKAVNTELHDIEVKQQELERQGVDLEKNIREVCERTDAERAEAGLDNNDRDSLGPEAEDLIIQLFELVNEKNELFRRQTELMYMKREHRLEEEHADIEHQIRVLMAKPDALRTDDDKKNEDKLIERLMAIVSQRNEIVDCLEMDRLRELEEDESIEIHMGEYAAIKPPPEDEKKKKKKKKEKKKKKKDKTYDADKDIDTSEFPGSLGSSPKPSPKKTPTLAVDKDKARKLKKKLLATLKPSTIKR